MPRLPQVLDAALVAPARDVLHNIAFAKIQFVRRDEINRLDGIFPVMVAADLSVLSWRLG
jgi:hypothetical protein